MNMKTIYKFVSVAALATLFLNSCIKETFPMSSTATTEQVGASASALEASVNGIPAQMSQGYLIYGNQTYENDMAYPLFLITFAEMTGEMYAVGDAGYDHYQSASTCLNYGPTDTRQTYVPWRTLYMFVKSANDVIGAINDETASNAQLAYKGMAYAYRAFSYFMLTSMYEPAENIYTDVSKVQGLAVPIVTEKTTEDEAKNNPRAKHDDMIKFILEDLDNAEKFLTGASVSSKMFPSLAVAYGIRAKVLMLDGKYAEAESYARKAIEASGCRPLTQDEWENPTSGFNTANSAWMWYTTYSAENMGNLCNFTGWMSAEADWGYASLTIPGIDKALYDRIPDTDFRKHSWVDPAKMDYYKYKTVRDEEWFDAIPDYTSLKFRCVSGDFETYSVGGVCDVPMMRVEEMYYIEAEAKAQQNLADGVKALNDFVQTYRQPDYNFSASSFEQFADEYVFQKKIEFWGEGISFHDIKRLKTGVYQFYEGTNAPGTNFYLNCEGIKPNMNFCIPTSEIENNKALDGFNNPNPSGTVEKQG